MTYQILKIVLEWALKNADDEKHGNEYRRALGKLYIALKDVMRFN